MRWKLVGGWLLAGGLLFGLNALPGPKASGAVMVPAPTITGSCPAMPGATSITCEWTVTGPPATTFNVLYPPHPVQPDCTVYPFAPCITYTTNTITGTSATFTQDVPCTANGQAAVDVLFSNPTFPENPVGTGQHFIDVTGTADLPGSCPPPTVTTTTTVPVTPVTTPPVLPGTGGTTMAVGPSPVASPDPTPAALAFTGAWTIPEVALGLFLIGLGALLVRKSRRLAR